MRKDVLVLHSGGLDSTVCLYLAHSQGHKVSSLGIDYGQRLSVELLFAAKQCREKNIERQVIQVQWTKPTTEIPLDRDLVKIRANPSPAFLPGRNLVFLALASAHGRGIGADELWIGINSVDFSGYPDCTPEFFEAFLQVQKIASPEGPTPRAPLLKKSKPEIAGIAKTLGIKPGDTWSCYQPEIISGNIQPCGRCDACKLHEYAWSANKA
jgi:7-cyano-7-deazaguanine synthase